MDTEQGLFFFNSVTAFLKYLAGALKKTRTRHCVGRYHRMHSKLSKGVLSSLFQRIPDTGFPLQLMKNESRRKMLRQNIVFCPPTNKFKWDVRAYIKHLMHRTSGYLHQLGLRSFNVLSNISEWFFFSSNTPLRTRNRCLRLLSRLKVQMNLNVLHEMQFCRVLVDLQYLS